MYYILFVIASVAKQSSNLCRRERDTNTCGAMDPGLRRDDDKKRNVREKPVIPRPGPRVPFLSSRGLGPAKTSVFVGGCRPRDPGNLCRRAATQIPAGQWIPACAGMTIKKNLKTKELKNLSSRGLTTGPRS